MSRLDATFGQFERAHVLGQPDTSDWDRAMDLVSLRLPALKGGLLALAAATLFGASTPLLQFFGRGMDAFSVAALLYAGAAIVGALSRRPRIAKRASHEATSRACSAWLPAVRSSDRLRSAWGLQRTSGTSASLMLTLEALFTALLAWRLYHETVDRRVVAAMTLLLAGGVS